MICLSPSLDLPMNYGGPASRGGPMSPVWILKHRVSVFINACRLLSALPSLSQLGQGRLSLVAISFYELSLLFGPCCLSEFTLAGPHYVVWQFKKILHPVRNESGSWNKVSCVKQGMVSLFKRAMFKGLGSTYPNLPLERSPKQCFSAYILIKMFPQSHNPSSNSFNHLILIPSIPVNFLNCFSYGPVSLLVDHWADSRTQKCGYHLDAKM